MNKIKTIVFDSFGTLFKVSKSDALSIIKNNILNNGTHIDEKEFKDEWKTFYKMHTASGSSFMTERDIFIARIKMLYEKYGLSRDAQSDAETLIAKASDISVYPETVEVINLLINHYCICIGSNTDNYMIEKAMKENSISVHKVYTSENLKVYKPDSRFYSAILDDQGVLPQEILFVGDSLTNDVLGPKKKGFLTVWVNRKGNEINEIPNYTVQDLRKLIDILKVQ